MYSLLANFACLLNITELSALVVLTFISSSENYCKYQNGTKYYYNNGNDNKPCFITNSDRLVLHYKIMIAIIYTIVSWPSNACFDTHTVPSVA